jgi:hypothetical protein
VTAIDPEHRELLGSVPDPDHIRHPTPRDQVDHRQVLGELHRFVQREQQGGDTDGQPVGTSGDGRSHGYGRRQVSVVDTVVLADDSG